MATSTITLYKGCKILPGKNFAVDSVSAYLETVPHTTFTNCQYIKDANKLSLSIRLDIDQSQLSGALSYSDSYNYCMIVNSDTDEMEYLYFITNKDWVSSRCIRLDLAMDVLNTYPKGTYYKLGDKTKIYRQHKDRIFHADIVTSSGVEQEAHTTTETGWTQLPDNTWTFNGTFSFDVPQGDGTLGTELSCDNNPISFEYELGSTATKGRFSVNYLYKLDFNLILDWTYTKSQWGRKIDFMPEGVNATLYHNSAADRNIEEPINTSWNLVYKNAPLAEGQTETDVIECYLYPDDAVQVRANSKLDAININNIDSYGYYYIFNDGLPNRITNFNKSFKLYDGEGNYLASVDGNEDEGVVNWVVINKVNDKLVLRQYLTQKSLVGAYTTIPVKTINNLTSIVTNLKTALNYYRSTELVENLNVINKFPTGVWANDEYVTVTLNSFNAVDRTDSKILKIIKLPYCPCDLEYEDGVIIVASSNWNYDTVANTLKLTDINSKLIRDLTTNVAINPLSPLSLNVPTLDTAAKRNDYYESKLYHSELYQPKITYDSFGFQFNLERVSSFDYLKQKKFDIDFIMTSTINSKFMFRFKDYNPINAIDDYPNVMIVSRNNEVSMYNSPYLDYLRNGYNYDQKAKTLSAVQNGLNVVFGGLGAGVNAAVISGGIGRAARQELAKARGLYNINELVDFDSPDAVRTMSNANAARQRVQTAQEGVNAVNSRLIGVGAAAGISVASGIANSVLSAVQTENSLNAKMASLQAQAVSVAGSDDLDLLEAYSGNRAKLITYKASDEVRALMADLFYYCGYVESAQASPNTNTRYWFNFVQCDADVERTTNIGEDIKAALRALYANGVTFLHTHQINNTWTWDFDQKNENWEVSVLN